MNGFEYLIRHRLAEIGSPNVRANPFGEWLHYDSDVRAEVFDARCLTGLGSHGYRLTTSSAVVSPASPESTSTV